jgi:hypothetical protein|tara:strand:- start:1481 stop:1657 length:177 start_codon:yes stop_codon:yes gene_type:complete
MILADVLLWVSVPFVLVTLFYGTKGGYYDTDKYDGNGTAHPVKFEENTCPRRETVGTK